MLLSIILTCSLMPAILESKFQNRRKQVFKTRISKRSADDCQQTLNVGQCNISTKYRAINGQCNNLNNPLWGSAMYCEQRLLPAYYTGSSGFRESVEGGPLPSPRTLSLNIHFNRDRPSNYYSHLYMYFGLLTAHDITQIPFKSGDPFHCCSSDGMNDPACKSVSVEEDDPFYSKFNTTCLSFERSLPCAAACSKNSRKLQNKITSFIDASFVYGSSEDQMMSLRENDGTGRLKVQKSPHGDLLPKTDDPENDSCSFPDKGEICFKAGDNRVNQNPSLTSLQTIFMREHNRIADALADINPHWNEDELFEEARRIVGAEMQAIIYKEYLPITLDDEVLSEFQLNISGTGKRTTYNPSIDPSILIEFATAAFRFGHTLINSRVSRCPLDITQGREYLRDVFFRPFGLYKGSIGPLMEEISTNPSQQFDRYLVHDVTDYLYRSPRHEIGLDLATLDINRGRDHGLPPYVVLVKYCSKGKIDIKTFEDLAQYKLMHREEAEVLEKNYRNVKDVELRPALLMEIPRGTSVVGPTSACIIGTQFHKLKFGDRFYFEHRDQAGSFTDEQLDELKKISFSTIICANTDTTRLSRYPFLLNSSNNPFVECRDVKSVNLKYWREDRQ